MGKLHVSEAAWATVMRTREGANGDQIALGAGSQQPPPQLAERRGPGTGCRWERATLPTWSIP